MLEKGKKVKKKMNEAILSRHSDQEAGVCRDHGDLTELDFQVEEKNVAWAP